MAFVDLEKAFDRVPRDVILWAMQKLGIYEWLVRLIQSMYKEVRSRVRVGSGYIEEFGVNVGVHQDSVISLLLFIIVLEALSREFRTGCPWELLYADALMISAVHGGTTVKDEDMESRDGEEIPSSEHGKDKDHGLWPQSGSSEKIWKGSLWRLSDRCWKKFYILWWLLVLDPQKMQWNQRPLTP